MKLLILAALVALAAAAPAHAQDDDANAIDDTPHITIVGTATAEVPPDLATLTLGVTSHKPTAVAAADAVAAAARAVVDSAKAQGVADADIATRSVTLTQAYDEIHDEKGRTTGRKPSGFDASNSISIRVHDLAKTGELAQSLIDKGANAFDGIAFTVEHPQPVRDRLAAEAVANAKRQADMVARAAGVRLARVLLVESPRSRAASRGFDDSQVFRFAPAMPVQAGTTTFVVEMEVTWAIAN